MQVRFLLGSILGLSSVLVIMLSMMLSFQDPILLFDAANHRPFTRLKNECFLFCSMRPTLSRFLPSGVV
jgi:hypothetical protein